MVVSKSKKSYSHLELGHTQMLTFAFIYIFIGVSVFFGSDIYEWNPQVQDKCVQFSKVAVPTNTPPAVTEYLLIHIRHYQHLFSKRCSFSE